MTNIHIYSWNDVWLKTKLLDWAYVYRCDYVTMIGVNHSWIVLEERNTKLLAMFIKKTKTTINNRNGKKIRMWCQMLSMEQQRFQRLKSRFYLQSLPVLVHFVHGFAASLWGALWGVSSCVQVHFVHLLEGLIEVVLQRGHGSTDGWWTKTVCDETEVGQAVLDARFQDWYWSTVAQWWTVLG